MKKMLVILAALAMLAMSNLAMAADPTPAVVKVNLTVAPVVTVASLGDVDCKAQGYSSTATGMGSLVITANFAATITGVVEALSGFSITTDQKVGDVENKIAVAPYGGGDQTMDVTYTVTKTAGGNFVVSDAKQVGTVTWTIAANS